MQDRLGASPAYQILHTFWAAADWLYPPICSGCQRPGTRWCADCDRKIEKIHDQSICPVCGLPQSGYQICHDCRSDPPPYRAIRSYAVYKGPIREAIHRMKYHSDLGISEIFARKLTYLFITTGWPVDLVTVVPLSRGRVKQRGYNQADLLARTFALAIKKPYRPGALRRVRETQSQVGLNADERRLNVQDAFGADAMLVAGKNVLIIDDVTTTGATLRECSRACSQNGANHVYGLTIARAVIPDL